MKWNYIFRNSLKQFLSTWNILTYHFRFWITLRRLRIKSVLRITSLVIALLGPKCRNRILNSKRYNYFAFDIKVIHLITSISITEWRRRLQNRNSFSQNQINQHTSCSFNTHEICTMLLMVYIFMLMRMCIWEWRRARGNLFYVHPICWIVEWRIIAFN